MHIRYRNINKSFTELTFQCIPSTGCLKLFYPGSSTAHPSPWREPGSLVVCTWQSRFLLVKNPIESKSPQSEKNESLCSFTGPHRTEYSITLSSHMVLFLDRRPDRDLARARRRGHLVLVQHLLHTGRHTWRTWHGLPILIKSIIFLSWIFVQDHAAAAMAARGVPVYAWKGETDEE